jgi:hypothetical protein
MAETYSAYEAKALFTRMCTGPCSHAGEGNGDRQGSELHAQIYWVIGRRAGVRLWLVPLPGNLILALLRGLEKMRWLLPASSENLSGVKALVAEGTWGDPGSRGPGCWPIRGLQGG